MRREDETPFATNANRNAEENWMRLGVSIKLRTARRPGSQRRSNVIAFVFVLLAFHTSAAVRYVSVDNASPMPPYTNWATAAAVIQEAVDVAEAGDEIVVTNGVYQSGGRAILDSFTNRVAVTKPLTLRSLNGPAVTLIVGHQVPGTINGSNAVRCVYLTNGAALIGFTLTNGATATSASSGWEVVGGGIRCESEAAVVSNCVVVANAADFHGGGVFSGTLYHCTLANNFSYEGGGAAESALNYCRLVNNGSLSIGSGALWSTLDHCLVTGNSNLVVGGGISHSTATHCTIVSNTAIAGGGGAAFAILNNCIIYHNLSSSNNPVFPVNHMSCQLNFCCTVPATPDPGRGGANNIADDPAFVDLAGGNLRLQPNSPCINAGRNAVTQGSVDLDGLRRIAGGTADIGAYEFQSPASALSHAWLLQHGLPLDGSADGGDPDGDDFSNYHEWRAGTDPRDAASLLRLLPPARRGAHVAVSWPSVPGRSYRLEQSADLGSVPHFTELAPNLAGAAHTNTTSFTHTNATGGGPWFYRVAVEE